LPYRMHRPAQGRLERGEGELVDPHRAGQRVAALTKLRGLTGRRPTAIDERPVPRNPGCASHTHAIIPGAAAATGDQG
jgi:hypothetical protein